MTSVCVAALQMVSGSDLQANLHQAERLIAQATEQGAQLLVLPEIFALYGADQLALGRGEAYGDAPVRQFLAAQARRHQIWLVGGSLPLAYAPTETRVLASCFLLDPQGRECARYDKLHLFDVDVDDQHSSYRESQTFCPGRDIVVADTPWGRLGLAICYDLRFPELFRAMHDGGLDMIALPAAFTLHTGRAHWLALLRARAIENQCLVIGANQGGQHSATRATNGQSAVIDSWGRVLVQLEQGEGVALARVDLAEQRRQRQAMPALQHRRLSVAPPR